jgi:XTP/dITP diphosphohydrolase
VTFERKLLIATTNLKKGGEMAEILGAANLNIAFASLADYPDAPEVDETGATFLENAYLKAAAAVELTGLVSIADDGGLCIDALDGSPGVHSHRFLGMDTPFSEKMRRIMEMMADVPVEKRTCRFQCAVVVLTPDGRRFDCVGTCEGQIGTELRGTYGFGYDPIFVLPETGCHMAELSPQEKHRISHRGKALAQAITALRTIF